VKTLDEVINQFIHSKNDLLMMHMNPYYWHFITENSLDIWWLILWTP